MCCMYVRIYLCIYIYIYIACLQYLYAKSCLYILYYSAGASLCRLQLFLGSRDETNVSIFRWGTLQLHNQPKKRTGRIDLFSYRGTSANSEYRCCGTTVPSRKRSTAAKSFNLVALPRQFSFVSTYYTVLSRSLVFRGSFKPTKVPSGVIAIVSKQQKKIPFSSLLFLDVVVCAFPRGNCEGAKIVEENEQSPNGRMRTRRQTRR